MKIPPKKPHFFKPIQPGFKNGIKIPIGFLKNVKQYEHIEHAILRKGGKKWLVKLNGQRLEEGWGKFAEEHDLQVGDILVFRHEGNMEFEVSIFGSSHCDGEYVEYLEEQQGGGEAHIVEETSIKSEFKVNNVTDKPNPGFTSSRKSFRTATHSSSGQSHFVCTIKQYCLSKGYLRIPRKFANANGLTNKKCGLIVRDERQRSWNLKLSTSASQVYLLGGWSEFRIANDLKLGDCMMFEVVTNGEKPIWQFHGKPYLNIKSSRKAFPHRKADKHKSFDHSHFVTTVRAYSISSDYLLIPKEFAVANGLTNKKCDLIIRDERKMSWNLRLGSTHSGVCIKGGWRDFCGTNCLKEGDPIMFEVVTNGATPIWKFHGKNSGDQMQASMNRMAEQ